MAISGQIVMAMVYDVPNLVMNGRAMLVFLVGQLYTPAMYTLDRKRGHCFVCFDTMYFSIHVVG